MSGYGFEYWHERKGWMTVPALSLQQAGSVYFVPDTLENATQHLGREYGLEADLREPLAPGGVAAGWVLIDLPDDSHQRDSSKWQIRITIHSGFGLTETHDVAPVDMPPLSVSSSPNLVPGGKKVNLAETPVRRWETTQWEDETQPPK